MSKSWRRNEGRKIVWIVSFLLKESDWKVWSRKCLAIAKKRGYKKILTGTLELTSSSDSNNKQVGMNAHHNLLLVLTKCIRFALVGESTSPVCPDRDAGKAWKKSKNKFKSQTSASKVKIICKVHTSRLTKRTKDPEV